LSNTEEKIQVEGMTTKKSKTYDLKNKTDSKRTLPKEVKRKCQNTKRIETFLPVSNEEETRKTANQSK
jgi:hypothetical protein